MGAKPALDAGPVPCLVRFPQHSSVLCDRGLHVARAVGRRGREYRGTRRGERKKREKRKGMEKLKTRTRQGKRHMKTTGNSINKKGMHSETFLRCDIHEIARNRHNRPIKQSFIQAFIQYLNPSTMGTRLVLQIQDKWRWSSQRYVLLQGIPESIDFLFFHAAWINAEAPVGWHIV
jgi:hypothetical protein